MIAHLFDYDEICRRWHQATVRNDMRTWLAVGYWLYAEAKVARADKLFETSDSLATISDVAMQRAKYLQPQRWHGIKMAMLEDDDRDPDSDCHDCGEDVCVCAR